VYILLQLISAENNYLGLPSVFEALQDRQSGFLLQKISEQPEPAETDFIVEGTGQSAPYTELLHNQRAMLVSERDHSWLVTKVSPSFHLLIVGGGVDARPLVSIASTLGWETTLCDPRPANGRREHFMNATRILRCHPNALGEETLFDHFDAAVVMTHNLELDAAAISVLQSSSIGYLALLGPIVRRNQVIEMANLSINQLTVPLSGPAGLRLGGELPEEIALSIIAECQAVATGSDAAFISASL
jgi:xanthine dehydrogenase accessory factor